MRTKTNLASLFWTKINNWNRTSLRIWTKSKWMPRWIKL